MIRRLLTLSLVGYAIFTISKARAQRSSDRIKDSQALKNWESEGGSPLPNVTTPA